MWWWGSRLIHERTASADALVVQPSPQALSTSLAELVSEDASEPPDESVRSEGGSLSIPELTRYHAVVGQSPDPCQPTCWLLPQ